MQDQTLPDLTAATAALRALYAAGWRPDTVTPLDGGAAEYVLIHPSGRQITAVTDRHAQCIDLDVRGLDLAQAVGAVTGAGLAPAVEQPRTIKARYLAAGMTVVYDDGTRDRVTGTIRGSDDVTVAFADGVTASYGVEEGVTVVGSAEPDATTPAELDPRRAAYELVLAGVAAGLPIPDETWIPSNNTVFTIHLANDDPASVDRWAAFLGLGEPTYGSAMRGPRRLFRAYETKGRNCPGMPGWLVDVQSFCDVPDADAAELEAHQAGGTR
ncbi:hypothetical protein [Micromonospora rubida]|uniref:hypothetical protein n=1 Tax=Micromonospora rubida TaxID=2697657 RepID=UPI001377956B|nr:hypothetical protein [Micromonospora rubida]NBE80346.1 hypothetical protein [Micromonospora rubida]